MGRANWAGCALILAIAMITVPGVGATTYYIDYDGGSDSNTGLSPDEAFQHCPGDPNATGTPTGVLIISGDTFIFKGGVYYRSTVVVSKSGASTMPLVFDGNTAGDYGEGRAIIDGADPVTGWTQCTSAAEVNGNPNYANIYWATIPAPAADVFHVNLCEGDQLLALAQDPNPTDPFYQDRTDTYLPIRNPVPANGSGGTEYVDATYFTQPDGYWGDDAWFAIYARTSRVYRRKVIDYIAAENKIVFQYLGESQYDAGVGKFTMFNAARILDRPGEYYVKLTPETSGMHKIFVWPHAGTSNMTISQRGRGFELKGSGITIQGFIIQKQANESFPSAIRLSDISRHHITIRNNIIRFVKQRNEPGYRSGAIDMYNASDCLIDGNQVTENSGAYGIAVTSLDDSVISNNTIHKAGASALLMYSSNRSSLIGNTLYNNHGMHANGLTLYNGNHDILVEGNHVSDGGACLTAQDGTNFIIRNNVFDGSGATASIAFWTLSNMANIQVTHNTLVNSNHSVSWMAAIYGQAASGDVLTIKNNIIDGLSGDLPGQISHNLYTSLGSHSLGAGEILQTNENLIFVNPAAGDFHLLPAAAAVDAGANLGVETDFDGLHRPMGAGYDMGAFELLELSADAGADQFVPDQGGDGTEAVTLDGAASLAPYSTIGAYLWAEGAATLGQGQTLDVDLPVGDHTITLTVYDDRGWNNSDTVRVSVASVLIADAGADQVLTDDDEDGIALVQLDGTGSFDPAGNIIGTVWTNEGAMVSINPVAFTVLPVGVHTITLTVTNGAGEQAVDTVQITVESGATLTPGDADGDGDVDLDDFVALKQNFGRTGDATWADGDFDGDSDVDLDDFVLLKQNFGTTSDK